MGARAPTKNFQDMKSEYCITTNGTREPLDYTNQYNDTLALQWAMRTLAKLKEDHPDLSRAILWKRDRNGLHLVQRFKRKES